MSRTRPRDWPCTSQRWRSGRLAHRPIPAARGRKTTRRRTSGSDVLRAAACASAGCWRASLVPCGTSDRSARTRILPAKSALARPLRPH